jgi:hypothetical protein
LRYTIPLAKSLNFGEGALSTPNGRAQNRINNENRLKLFLNILRADQRIRIIANSLMFASLTSFLAAFSLFAQRHKQFSHNIGTLTKQPPASETKSLATFIYSINKEQ